MELQLWIEKGATREILWSDTVLFSNEIVYDEGDWWKRLCHLFPYLEDHPSSVVWIPLVLIIGIVVLFKFLRALTRVR